MGRCDDVFGHRPLVVSVTRHVFEPGTSQPLATAFPPFIAKHSRYRREFESPGQTERTRYPIARIHQDFGPGLTPLTRLAEAANAAVIQYESYESRRDRSHGVTRAGN